ncbi:MAG: hypothetical protein ACI9QR_000751 [Flavobacteriaceae bacterium]|jgi:hypothetical protein
MEEQEQKSEEQAQKPDQNAVEKEVKQELQEQESTHEGQEEVPIVKEAKQEEKEAVMLRKEEIIALFESLVKSEDVVKKKSNVQEWKNQFHALTKVEERAQAKAFEEKEEKEEGEQFVFEADPLDNRWKELYNIYLDKVSAYKKALADAEKENLKAKEDLVKELKKIVEEEMTNVGAAFTAFYAIRDKWTAVGEVNKANFKQLQYDYSHYRDLFYYNVGIHDELKNYDFKKNAIQKKEVLEELKALAGQDSIRKMEKEIKNLQGRWDEIGPTSNEVWEELKTGYWDMVNGIYDKIRDHYKAIREAQGKVLEQKHELILKMEELVANAVSYKSPKEWIQSSKFVNELHKEWKASGYAARAKEEEIWAKFKEMSDQLRKQQNVFFDELKQSNEKVVEAKNKLIEKAKELKDSKQWKDTTEALIKLQRDWKNMGHAQYKQDQKLWEQFRKACDGFFNSKKEYYDTLDDRQAENFKQKAAVAANIAKSKTEEELRVLIAEWQAVDYVPKKQIAAAEASFDKAVIAAAKTLKIDEDSLGMIKFEAKVSAIKDDENAESKLKSEKMFVQTQIEKIQEELHRFEENMAFFGPSKGAQKLKEIVDKKVVEAAGKLQAWKDKMNLLR